MQRNNTENVSNFCHLFIFVAPIFFSNKKFLRPKIENESVQLQIILQYVVNDVYIEIKT